MSIIAIFLIDSYLFSYKLRADSLQIYKVQFLSFGFLAEREENNAGRNPNHYYLWFWVFCLRCMPNKMQNRNNWLYQKKIQ